MTRFRPISVAFGILLMLLSAYLFFHLGPMLFQPDLLHSVLIVLPSKHPGFGPIGKILFFCLMIGMGLTAGIWGCVSLIRHRSPRIHGINTVILAQIVIGLIALEAVFRALVAFEAVPRPAFTYIANPVCGETFYRLQARPPAAKATRVFDPYIGWLPRPRPGNPKGLPWPETIDGRNKIWFFGDSFMEGAVAPAHTIPARVEQEQPERQSLNFGVSGYGVDQIWLRYETESTEIPTGSDVVMGLLTTDIDRSVLSYFWAPKPVLTVVSGGLEHRTADTANAHRPANITSYAFAALGAARELIESSFDRSEARCGITQKKVLNEAILDAVIDRAREQGHRLTWVLFAPSPEFHKLKRWRYDLLTDYFEDRNQRFLDTLALLSNTCEARTEGPEFFYIPGNGHPNAIANQLIAQSLTDMLYGPDGAGDPDAAERQDDCP